MTKVLYNAECPVCSFEIDHYAAYARKNALPIQFDDLNGAGQRAWQSRWGLDADSAARRLYVEHDGVLLSGIEAFILLWRQMPRYRFLARIVALPGIKQISTLAYDYAAAPLIYRWHLRRKSRAV
ncbi:MAG: DUF393 domain-containing protein [Pseudomonadota bacterium]